MDDHLVCHFRRDTYLFRGLLRLELARVGRTARALCPAMEGVRVFGFAILDERLASPVLGVDYCSMSSHTCTNACTDILRLGSMGSWLFPYRVLDPQEAPTTIPSADAYLYGSDVWRCLLLRNELGRRIRTR